jgi:hypothetical protein
MAARPSRRQKSRGLETLGTLLSRASPDDAAPRATPLPPRAWYDAVGDRVARRTRPIRLERKVLTIRAATAVWAQELSFLAPAIVKRLNALGCEIDSLRFCVGPVEAPSRAPKPLPVRWVPPPKPLPKDLSLTLARIEDPVLRRTIARAATANLAWQEATGATSTSTRPNARDPRAAVPRNDRPAQSPPTTPGASRRTPGAR